MNHLQKQAVQPDGISFRRWQSGEKIGFTDLTGDFLDVYEEPYYVVHRAHYHSALHHRAKELGVKIRLNSRVHKYDAERGTITLTGGEVFQGDFIVAADGEIASCSVLCFHLFNIFIFALTKCFLLVCRYQIDSP